MKQSKQAKKPRKQRPSKYDMNIVMPLTFTKAMKLAINTKLPKK